MPPPRFVPLLMPFGLCVEHTMPLKIFPNSLERTRKVPRDVVMLYDDIHQAVSDFLRPLGNVYVRSQFWPANSRNEPWISARSGLLIGYSKAFVLRPTADAELD